jgi:hypothetical protein
MTSLALPAAAVALRRGVLAELLDRQRTLTLYAAALLIVAIPVAALQAIDPRTLSAVSVWVKPAKFLVSVAIFAATAAWFFGYVRAERRRSRLMRGIVAALIVAATLELAYIGWQAAHGQASHFNTGTIFHAVMYGVMGLLAVIMVGTCLPLAWEIARRPAPGLTGDFVAAVATGLVLTVLLGGGLGGYMSAQPGHSVGAQGASVALFGWNRAGGDLRIAHFLGIHAQQAIPLIAACAVALPSRQRWAVLAAGTGVYVALTLAIFAQAIAGRPPLPL